MLKRAFDILFSMGGILVLSPILFLLWLMVKLESKGSAIYRQVRVGRNNKDFTMFKFRSMYVNAEKSGQLTVGMRDPRITRVGYYLRKFKLDELPQLFNVLNGTMSFVGPRPEVRKYVNYYTPEQMKVLTLRPGITDYASLRYYKENEILGKSANPEKDYIELIMPEKLQFNLQYVSRHSVLHDIGLIFQTILKIFT